MNRIPQIILLISLALLGSCNKYVRFIPDAPPFPPVLLTEPDLVQVGPPPVYLSEKKITEIAISSQYFKVAIPPATDMTGQAEGIKNTLADMLYTELFNTKRFNLMDRGEIQNISQRSTVVKSEKIEQKEPWEPEAKPQTPPVEGENVIAEPNAGTIIEEETKVRETLNIKEESVGTRESYGRFETDSELMSQLRQQLRGSTDGILQMVITSIDEANAKLGIDYRIISSVEAQHPIILYSSSNYLNYYNEPATNTLTLDRRGITEIAENIKREFPDPDSEQLMRIIEISGKRITVDAGKNKNIVTGMLGYVVRDEDNRLAYRSLFQVTEVFPETFNAELILDPEVTDPDLREQYSLIINMIQKGELIKMK